MGTLRFGFVTMAVFAAAFIGISWAQKGFPLVRIGTAEMKPDPRIPTFEQSARKGIRQDWEVSKTAQSDGDKRRDQLRLELSQAANAYELSPCDPTIRKNLIAAMTAYTMAWAELAGCRNGYCAWDDKKLGAAAAAFKTPADKRVHEALREAVAKGGINRDDFPRAIRDWAMHWSGLPFGEPEACHAHRRDADMGLR
jgi:hypothetical protein